MYKVNSTVTENKSAKCWRFLLCEW